jgi:hypothetical protein
MRRCNDSDELATKCISEQLAVYISHAVVVLACPSSVMGITDWLQSAFRNNRPQSVSTSAPHLGSSVEFLVSMMQFPVHSARHVTLRKCRDGVKLLCVAIVFASDKGGRSDVIFRWYSFYKGHTIERYVNLSIDH